MLHNATILPENRRARSEILFASCITLQQNTAAALCSNTLQQCAATTHCNNTLQHSLSREQFVVAVCCCSVLLQSVAAECCCSVLLQCDANRISELPVARRQDFAGMDAVAFVPKS